MLTCRPLIVTRHRVIKLLLLIRLPVGKVVGGAILLLNLRLVNAIEERRKGRSPTLKNISHWK